MTMTDTEAKAPTDTLIARLESADGHWSAGAHELATEYAARNRNDLAMPNLTDFQLANAVYLAGRGDLDLIAYQTAAKERIRWLSVQLALAAAALKARGV